MDICASNWNEADASNSAAAPDGWPEGMAPSGVNDSGRAMMGALKRWYNWTIPKATGGTSTAYTLTYGVAPSALVDGMSFVVNFHTVNGTGATLNVNGFGLIPLRHYANGTWYNIPPGWIGADAIHRITYHQAGSIFRIVDGDLTPTGVSLTYRGGNVPPGYLLEDGAAISRSAYPALFAQIGTTYGGGDGSTTFNKPDSRGRIDVGRDNMGGAPANRITNSGSSIDGLTLGASGGSQTTTVSIAVGGTASGLLTGYAVQNLASQVAAAASGDGASSVGHDHAVTVTGTMDVNASGISNAFSIVQPSVVANKMIRT